MISVEEQAEQEQNHRAPTAKTKTAASRLKRNRHVLILVTSSERVWDFRKCRRAGNTAGRLSERRYWNPLEKKLPTQFSENKAWLSLEWTAIVFPTTAYLFLIPVITVLYEFTMCPSYEWSQSWMFEQTSGYRVVSVGNSYDVIPSG